MKVVPKSWGFELIVENNDMYCLKVLTCEDQLWSSKGKFHYHHIKDETFLVIEGILELDTVEPDGSIKSRYLKEGEAERIFPGQKHRFRSVTRRCKFIEASTPDFVDDSIRTELVTKDKQQTWVDEPRAE